MKTKTKTRAKAKRPSASKQKSDDNILAMYLGEISRIPLLTREEEDKAARAAAQGNIAARDKLIKGNLRFVVNVAKKYQGQGLPLLDLISEGNIGLMYAVERFDVDRGCHFISYAVWWIRQFILKALCDKSRLIRLPVNRAADIVRINKAKKMLPGNESHNTETHEIAQMLSMDEGRVEDMVAISKEIVSLDMKVNTNKGASPLGSFIEDNRYEAPEQEIMHKALEVDIDKLLDTLDSKEAEIIRCRYGLGHQKPLSLKELGERYAISKERVRQIEQKALARLQHPSRIFKLKAYVA